MAWKKQCAKVGWLYLLRFCFFRLDVMDKQLCQTGLAIFTIFWGFPSRCHGKPRVPKWVSYSFHSFPTVSVEVVWFSCTPPLLLLCFLSSASPVLSLSTIAAQLTVPVGDDGYRMSVVLLREVQQWQMQADVNKCSAIICACKKC